MLKPEQKRPAGRPAGWNGDKKVDKVYWTISEVAEMLGVTADRVRKWLYQFNVDTGKRHHKGRDRIFTKSEIALVREIQRLTCVELFTIEGAKRQLKIKEARGI